MFKFSWRLPQWFYGKIILGALCAVVLTQIILFLLYSQKTDSAEFKVNRDIVARQVVSVLETIRNMPLDKRQDFIDDLNIPNLDVSLDEKPLYQPRFEQISLFRVLTKISEQKPNIKLSYYLGSNQWLSIVAKIEPNRLSYQFFLLIIEIILTLFVIFSLWNINRFTLPLKNFAQAAEHLGVNLKMSPLSVVNGPAVVRATAEAMNKMQERITDLIAARTQMLAAISHDLRTPITRMKLRAQFLKNDDIQKKMIVDLDQMEEMIRETLSFARDDVTKVKRVPLDLASLLSSLCDEYSEMGQHVIYKGHYGRIAYSGNVLSLKRMFSNLIDNAVKYGNGAQVLLRRRDKEIHVFIKDQGPGIAKEYIDKVFIPFFREASRSRETGGVGLGLAVALDIARAHGGNIILQNRAKGGLVAKVILPLIG